MFIATMGNPDIQVGDSVKLMYDKMVCYLSWQDRGQLIVPGVWAAGDVKRTGYEQRAYELGRNL